MIYCLKAVGNDIMAKYISIPSDLEDVLDRAAPKDEEGRREETYSQTIKRLIKKYDSKEE